jgi:hypothetical protein
MGWVQCHKRRGAFLALAALALQVALSFGHVHLDGIRPVTVHDIATSHEAALVEVSRQMPTHNPADDDDYCPICASIYLASTSFVSQPPPLPVPVGFHRIAHSYSVAFSIVEPRRIAFQSRAPPNA